VIIMAEKKTEKKKTPAVKTTSDIQVKTETPKPAVKEPAKTVPEAEAKPEAKKEPDASKEFVDGIMAEMALKGASKKRLIKMLAEQYGLDKQRVMFKLKRALITERYAAAHAEAGH
jgi:hydroxymethylpyrimidine pyrophosphatase-like HAD family hydrolase